MQVEQPPPRPTSPSKIQVALPGSKKVNGIQLTAKVGSPSKNEDNLDLKIHLENRDEFQINAKLFIKTFDIDLCVEAVQCLKKAFDVTVWPGQI